MVRGCSHPRNRGSAEPRVAVRWLPSGPERSAVNPITDTAYYCCGVRMDDAERTPSVCNDHFARRFMSEHGLRVFEEFRSLTLPNISNVVRCRIIDDFVQRELDADPGARVVTIGAGFDTRPYRLRGGQWYEFDEPQLIGHKDECLPVADSPNPLQRRALSFASGAFSQELRDVPANGHVVIVIEGVFMYLEPDAIAATLRALRERFPRHILLCDLMNRGFFERFGGPVHEKIVAIGARFSERPVDPAAIFLEQGYSSSAEVPMFRRALELGVLWRRARMPGFIVRIMLAVAKDLSGFAVRRFVYG
jgi:O-methyltransferase involved in polyketide biosynthesis